jgi:hypothetical protein
MFLEENQVHTKTRHKYKKKEKACVYYFLKKDVQMACGI